VLIATKRARQLAGGAEPMVERDNDKNTVIALREIAEGLVTASILDEDDTPIVTNPFDLEPFEDMLEEGGDALFAEELEHEDPSEGADGQELRLAADDQVHSDDVDGERMRMDAMSDTQSNDGVESQTVVATPSDPDVDSEPNQHNAET